MKNNPTIELIKTYLQCGSLEADSRLITGESVDDNFHYEPLELFLGNIIFDYGIPLDGKMPGLSKSLLDELSQAALARMRLEYPNNSTLIIRLDFDPELALATFKDKPMPEPEEEIPW